MARLEIPADWPAIRSLYLDGATYKDLASRFGVKEGTIKARASRENWSKIPVRHRNATIRSLHKESGEIASELWSDRREKVRNQEFTIASKILTYAEQMDEDQLLAKVDKVKLGVDMARRASGLDREENNKNAVNIAILSDIDGMSTPGVIYENQPVAGELEQTGTKEVCEGKTTDFESVSPTTPSTTVPSHQQPDQPEL
jgi:hypothetical protein